MYNDIRREQAMRRMRNNTELLKVYEIEKQNMDLIIDQALNYPSSANRWTAYEMLKRQASLIVGWDADRSSPIATAQHYELLTDFIDYLLPQSNNDLETPRGMLYIDENAVSDWRSHAEQVLETMQQQRVQLQPPNSEGRTRFLRLMTNNDGTED